MPNAWHLRRVAMVLLLATVVARPASAQAPVTFVARALFFADNTEFRNPFREGETILGSAAWLAADIPLNDRVTLIAGGFGLVRHGGEAAFELTRPVLTLRLRSDRSELLIGTLDVPRVGSGPDRAGPHGLVAPLQRETLAFERPYEAGLQWTFDGASLRHDAWLNWQRLNTPAHRERFDAGVAGEAVVTPWLAVPFQAHIVHEGGQLFDAGPVADSTAFGAGVTLTRTVAAVALRVETLGLISRYVPDRERSDRFVEGSGMFARAAAERDGWRVHAIVWQGRDFVKVEGDPNYLSMRQDGTRVRGTRRYAEAGITRTFRPADEAAVETSARLHRVQDRFEYSFRVLGIVELRRPR